jgi:hypothetical protein
MLAWITLLLCRPVLAAARGLSEDRAGAEDYSPGVLILNSLIT